MRQFLQQYHCRNHEQRNPPGRHGLSRPRRVHLAGGMACLHPRCSTALALGRVRATRTRPRGATLVVTSSLGATRSRRCRPRARPHRCRPDRRSRGALPLTRPAAGVAPAAVLPARLSHGGPGGRDRAGRAGRRRRAAGPAPTAPGPARRVRRGRRALRRARPAAPRPCGRPPRRAGRRRRRVARRTRHLSPDRRVA